MTEHAVVIAGGEPTGMMLAGELALAGVDVVIVERRTSQDDQKGLEPEASIPARSRCSISVASRTDSWPQGTRSKRWASPGSRWTSATSHATATCWRCGSASSSPSWPPGSRNSASGSFVRLRGAGFSQDDQGVDVELSGDTSLRADYLVGCDGGRSLVRKAAGIDFAGMDPSRNWLIAEVEMEVEPEIGMRREGGGIGPVNRREEEGRTGSCCPRSRSTASDPTMQDLSEALVAAYGTDYEVHSPTWISRFTDMSRQAVIYRHERTARRRRRPVHPPHLGGQGLSTGVQDAL